MEPTNVTPPEEPGKAPTNPPGTPDPNIVALQKKLSERDVELKAAKEKLAVLEKEGKGTDETSRAIAEMSATIKQLGDTITKMESDKERERLRSKYPDIVPDLLMGRSDEDIERLVTAQRETITKNYVRQPSAHAPQFADRAAVETEMARVEADKSLPVAEKFAKLRELKNQRDEF